MPSLDDIPEAEECIRLHLRETTMDCSPYLGILCGRNIPAGRLKEIL